MAGGRWQTTLAQAMFVEELDADSRYFRAENRALTSRAPGSSMCSWGFRSGLLSSSGGQSELWGYIGGATLVQALW